LDTKEAANLIKYEVTSIYRLVKRKKIPFCKIEGKLLFSRRKLIEWIERGNHAPTLNRPSLPLKEPVTKYRYEVSETATGFSLEWKQGNNSKA
jgi:excisionase family DNA binding protein